MNLREHNSARKKNKILESSLDLVISRSSKLAISNSVDLKWGVRMACKFSTIHTPSRVLIYGPRSFETPPWEHSLAGKEERMNPLTFTAKSRAVWKGFFFFNLKIDLGKFRWCPLYIQVTYVVGLTVVGLRCKQSHNVHGPGQGGIKPTHQEGESSWRFATRLGYRECRQLPPFPLCFVPAPPCTPQSQAVLSLKNKWPVMSPEGQSLLKIGKELSGARGGLLTLPPINMVILGSSPLWAPVSSSVKCGTHTGWQECVVVTHVGLSQADLGWKIVSSWTSDFIFDPQFLQNGGDNGHSVSRRVVRIKEIMHVNSSI